MSSIQSLEVYTGPWINHSQGTVLGATITLSARNGGLLVAFLGVFVTLVGGQLWKILSFTLHQIRASKGPHDGLHYQHQNILRNTPTPGAASWELFSLVLPWWKRARRPGWRTVPLALVPLTCFLLFTAAGILYSEVTKAAGKERLVKGSKDCGSWDYLAGYDDSSKRPAAQERGLGDTFSAESYARTCYNDDIESRQCEIYVQKKVPFGKVDVSSCPFQDDICREFPGSAAFQMDTGLLDSHEVFGINAAPENRVTFQKVTTCSPLKTAGYFSEKKAEEIDMVPAYAPGDVVRLYLYGEDDTDYYTFSYNTRESTGDRGYTVR